MNTLVHRFVQQVPQELEDGVVYVSIPFSTVIHRCCCGCGHEVVTPLSPDGWQLIFDGESVSLFPSIGNRALPCRSHYWIRNNCVQWAGWPEDARQSSPKKMPRRSEHRDAAVDNNLQAERTPGANMPRRRLWRWLHRD